MSAVYAVKHFKYYFEYQIEPVIIQSDCKALLWLEKQKNSPGKLGRWAAELADINYKIIHKPGVENTVPDLLSRLYERPSNGSKPSPGESQEQEEVINIISGSSDDDFANHQREDDLCKKIIRYLDEGELELEDKLRMLEWAKNIDLFKVHDGLLYREAIDSRRSDNHFQLVVPAALKRKIMNVMQSSLLGGHFAYLKTFHKIYRKFWWLAMRSEIKDFCRACPACQENSSEPPRASLLPTELPTRPNMVLYTDTLGPVKPTSFNGNKHCIILADHFSKFIKLRAIKDLQAETLAKAIVEMHIMKDGVFPILVSDRHKSYTSKLLKEINAMLGIKHSLTCAYRPSSDHQSERTFRTIKSMMKRLLRGYNHASWDEFLPFVAAALNDSVHASTMQTPYYLEHGTDFGFSPTPLCNLTPTRPPMWTTT